jgi:hypothetical protein
MEHPVNQAIYSVGQAAEWLAKTNEPKDIVANQLRRFRAKGYVRTRGTFGAGPTATNTFEPIDLGVAKFCRALTAFGIKDETVMRAVADACYDLPAKGHDTGAFPGMLAAINHPHSPWNMVVFLHDNDDGTQHVLAEMWLGLDALDHIGGEKIILSMADWLPKLAEMQGT